MFVSDLRHFLDLPHDAAGPVRTLAEQLGFVVRAATAGPVGARWTSALPCRRRPGHHRCPGHLTVLRAGDEAPLAWRCTACGDEGTISNWQDSPSDLRRPPARARWSGKPIAVSVTEEIAATLRGLMLLDPDCERVVFQTHAGEHGLVLAATEEELEELVGFVAADANHEPNPRHQKRLDAALNLLTDALPCAGF